MAGMVIEIPEQFNRVGEAVLALLARLQGSVKLTGGGKAWDYAHFEAQLQSATADIEVAGHGCMLEALDIDAPRVKIGGRLYHRVGRNPEAYFTAAGPVEVVRSLYREAGVRNGPTVDPVAVRTGAVDDVWLPGAARQMAYLMASGTSREAAQASKELGRVQYSRSSFQRLGHAVGELYVGVHADIEDELLDSFTMPEVAASVTVSLDRVSLPMEEPRPRPVGRPKKDAPKNPCERVFHMAWVGTVTVHDATGHALYTRRHGRMPSADPNELCAVMLGDVLALQSKAPDIKFGILCDGAHELWALLEPWFNEETLGRPPYRLVDLWHLTEKLGSAAKVLFSRKAEVESAMSRWKLGLLNSSGRVMRILGELTKSGKENIAVGESRPVHDAITYINNHHERMDYATAKRAGLAVGSGNVEATCKSLVAMRMKRPGARWKEQTGEHILHLRGLVLSDLWDGGMRRMFESMSTSVRRAA